MGWLTEQTLADFSETGVLSGATGFEFRPQQQQMAAAVAQALENSEPLLVEAGTGVGKSLAYLIPSIRFALQNGRKAVVSTHTINLQEQLFHKDIPTVKKALGCQFQAALLKGRANYLCKTRLRRAMEQSRDLFNQAEAKQLHQLLEWYRGCPEASLSELPEELEISPKVWAQVCSENHVCTARNCGPDCPYQAARRRVQEADVVVLNHTLFFGLLSLADEMADETDEERMDGFIFPGDFVILDEAHTIENVAAQQLGISLREADLKYDLLRLYSPRTHKGSLRQLATPNLIQLIEDAQTATEEFFKAARADCRLEENRGTVRLRTPDWTEDILSPSLNSLYLEIHRMAADQESELTRAELKDTAARILAFANTAKECVHLTELESSVYWAETYGQDGAYTNISSALVNVADVLREKLFESGRTCICTSATLSGGDRGMGYFAGRVGAESAPALRIGSPFDFARQMHVSVVGSMPPPPANRASDSEVNGYKAALADWIMRALDMSGGRAFVLFTSYALLRDQAARLRPFCEERGWTLLAQGDGRDRSRLLRMFKTDVDSVLLGTDSFWMGVDVPGEALSNVIITRIPFESPGNPLVEARNEDVVKRGGNSFTDYSLPEAVLKFRQGIGRLIRSKTDTGMVVLLDSRISSRYRFYGHCFLDAIPEGAVKEFL